MEQERNNRQGQQRAIEVEGAVPLHGEVRIQGSKNAALPILAASILIPGITRLENCPHIADVECMRCILEEIGCESSWHQNTLEIRAFHLTGKRLPAEYVTRMRSSVMLMGPLLGRVGEVSMGYPGGCVIGDRPIDIHLQALQAMGAVYEEEKEGWRAVCTRLKGAVIRLPFPSVGATENLIMAAVAAEGETEIRNAAREPEILALCQFLKAAGADITGAGSRVLRIRGAKRLQETSFRIRADRIVAGTYLFACMAAGGEVFLKEAPAMDLQAVIAAAREMGADVEEDKEGLRVSAPSAVYSPGRIRTAVYPGFPTDLQSPLMAVLCRAAGVSWIEERIFNGRFRIVEALNRMGAGIHVEKGQAWIPGGRRLQGRPVEAEELRGGAALVIAGLEAEGRTQIGNRHFIERGYEDICRDLRALGARIGS